MTPRTLTRDEHVVRDGQRELHFEGELLATSSSRQAWKDRWAEFQLYRTTAGKYVLAGVGRSTRAGEQDNFWAQVSDDPRAVVERLTMLDDHDVRYLPRTAKALLTDAGQHDEGISQAYSHERID